MVALLGPSGCGKTTTLRMIAGLIAPPSGGDILIGGRSITGVPVHKRNIGMLFQSYALFPHLSVGQNVAFGLEMRGVSSRAEAARRVKDALAAGAARPSWQTGCRRPCRAGSSSAWRSPAPW